MHEFKVQTSPQQTHCKLSAISGYCRMCPHVTSRVLTLNQLYHHFASVLIFPHVSAASPRVRTLILTCPHSSRVRTLILTTCPHSSRVRTFLTCQHIPHVSTPSSRVLTPHVSASSSSVLTFFTCPPSSRVITP